MAAKFRGMEDSFKRMLTDAVSSLREEGSIAPKGGVPTETMAGHHEEGTSAAGGVRRSEIPSLSASAQRGETPNLFHNEPNRRHVKMEFPKFREEDPTSWVSKAKQYFAYQEMPLEQRVSFASYHLEDEANEWWQATSKALDEDGVSVSIRGRTLGPIWTNCC